MAGDAKASKDIVAKKIKAGQIMKGYSTKELAIKMHISPSTLTRKLNLPEELKVKDLRKFEKVLDIKLLA